MSRFDKERMRRVVSLVIDEPGVSCASIAKAIGMTPNALGSGTLLTAVNSGFLVRKGEQRNTRYFPGPKAAELMASAAGGDATGGEPDLSPDAVGAAIDGLIAGAMQRMQGVPASEFFRARGGTKGLLQDGEADQVKAEMLSGKPARTANPPASATRRAAPDTPPQNTQPAPVAARSAPVTASPMPHIPVFGRDVATAPALPTSDLRVALFNDGELQLHFPHTTVSLNPDQVETLVRFLAPAFHLVAEAERG